jgi:N-sulfoglucosamine sulfohydrolase
MIDNRRSFLSRFSGGILGLSSYSSMAAKSPAERPNILWLISEDTSPDIGCYGAQVVKTPNLDKLASEGLRFNNAFVTSPVCSASRSAFMTGMYQTSIGAHQHRTHDPKPLPNNVRPITEYFRDAGYFVTNQSGVNPDKPGKTDWNFTVPFERFDGTDWHARKPGQPFFAQINFPMTHRTFRPDHLNPINHEDVALPPYYPDHPLAKRDWADYLEDMQILDRAIGAVLQKLETDGLADNTMVVYFGDGGRPHVRGKEFLYEGGIRVPLIMRWPRNLEAGEVFDALVSAIDIGPTCMSLAGLTIPDSMEGQPFLGPDAQTRNYIIAARDRCGSTYDRMRCVRTARYKYIKNFLPHLPWFTQSNLYKRRQYPVLTLMEVLYAQGRLTPEQARFMAPSKPAEELYDLDTDPHELHNLAEELSSQAILSDLRMTLSNWIQETGDKGQISEDSAIAAERHRKALMPGHARVMAQRDLSVDVAPQEYLKWWEKELFGSNNR